MKIDEYTLRLRGIRVQSHIGADRRERSLKQELVVDVDLTLPVTSLPRRDRRRDVVDYDAVACAVAAVSDNESFALLETFVLRAAERLLAETPASSVRVAATKGRVPTTYPVDAAMIEILARRDAAKAQG